MKTPEELNWIHTCMCANDPAVHGQLLPAPKMMAFIELVQKDASLDAYEKGIRDAAASDCVNHVPACHCAVCEFRNRILALLTKPKDKE